VRYLTSSVWSEQSAQREERGREGRWGERTGLSRDRVVVRLGLVRSGSHRTLKSRSAGFGTEQEQLKVKRSRRSSESSLGCSLSTATPLEGLSSSSESLCVVYNSTCSILELPRFLLVLSRSSCLSHLSSSLLRRGQRSESFELVQINADLTLRPHSVSYPS
jgi:hypothetical protein